MPLTRIGPDRAKIVKSHTTVSTAAMIAAKTIMNRIVKNAEVSRFNSILNRKSGTHIFRLNKVQYQLSILWDCFQKQSLSEIACTHNCAGDEMS